jgi:hypothetical protein
VECDCAGHREQTGDDHHRGVDPAAGAVRQQAEGVPADVEAVADHRLDGPDPDVQRAGERAREQK